MTKDDYGHFVFPCRSKAAALLEIIGSGEALEERIAQHGDLIDADMLEARAAFKFVQIF